MIKKIISEYGDIVVSSIVALVLIPLLWWILSQGPLYSFITKFIF